MFRRHQHLYSATDADLGAVVVAQRKWAILNPIAVHRDPMTIESYLDEEYYIEPIRASDVAGFHNGGVALVMTSLDRARDFPHAPVVLTGMAQVAPLRGLQNEDNLERRWIARGCRTSLEVRRGSCETMSTS